MGAVTQPPITLEGLACAHAGRIVFDGLSGTFASGSLTAVIGPTGAGKTTLLRTLMGLHPAASGRIARGPGQIALLPQASHLDRTFPLPCRDVVALGAWSQLGPVHAASAALIQSCQDALAAVGLAGVADTLIDRLSSGQFQRVLFARLLVQDADILLLDEPFTAVDAATEADLLALMIDLHRQGRTIVAVLHDLDLVARYFPQTLLLSPTRVAWGNTAAVLPLARSRVVA